MIGLVLGRGVVVAAGRVLLAGLAPVLAGCSPGLEGIDARTDRLLAERSASINAPAYPRRSFGDPAPTPRVSEQVANPGTVYPGAGELEFTAADPARDVAGSFAGYIGESTAGGEPLVLDLAGALAIAQRTGREYLSAEEDYITAAIRLLIERHAWSPRWFDDVSATLSGDGTDGRFESAVAVVNDLRVTQRLPYGGSVEARLVWNATEQLREQATGRYRQSSELALDASIPLMRGSGLVARESLLQAERDLVYAARAFEQFRGDYLVSVTRDYLDLLQGQARIANQKRQLESLSKLYEQVKARADAGLTSQFEVALTANQLVGAVASLAGARDSYLAQQERFKVRLGIPLARPLRLRPTALDLSEPDISLAEATSRSLEYRLDLQTRRDGVEDSRRAMDNARDGLRPDLNLSGSIGVPTDPAAREGGLLVQPEELNYTAGLTLSLPLDREIERLSLRSSIIAFEQARRSYAEFEDNLVLGVRSAVRQIPLARFQLRLAEEQVRINELRQQEQEIKADDVTPQERVDTENDLLNALNARDDAQTRLRIAVLDYLVRTGQIRVSGAGEFQALPGLSISPVSIFTDMTNFDDWATDPPIVLPELGSGSGGGP